MIRSFIAAVILAAAMAANGSAQTFDVVDSQTTSGSTIVNGHAVNVSSSGNGAMVFISMTSDAASGTSPDSLSSAPKWNGSNTGVTQIGSTHTESATFKIGEQKYYLIAPTSGVHASSCDSYSQADSDHYCAIVSITGADQTTPVRDSNRSIVNNSMGDTSPSVACSSAQAGDLIIVVLAQLSSTGSFAGITSVGTLTLRDTGTSTTGIQGFIYTDTATGSGYTATITLGSPRDYMIDCFAIASATGAPANTTNGFFVLIN